MAMEWRWPLAFLLAGAAGVACGGPATEVPWIGQTPVAAQPRSTPPAAAPTPTPAPQRAQLGRASSVVAVKDAAVAAGFPCPRWVQDNVVKHADQSGHCSSSDVFVWYASDARFAKGHEQMVANQRMIEEVLHHPAEPLLVGPNWMITSQDVLGIQHALGGTIER